MSTPTTRWECTVCGYIHVGAEPPESCPLCGAPASAFRELPAEPEGVPAELRLNSHRPMSTAA